MFCPKCGSEVSGNATFCYKCGVRLAEEAGVSRESRLATTLLCLLPPMVVGLHGIHRLYLGKTATGGLMLLLGIASLPLLILGTITPTSIVRWFGIVFLIFVCIWTTVDFVLAVSGKMKDKEGKPVKNWSSRPPGRGTSARQLNMD